MIRKKIETRSRTHLLWGELRQATFGEIGPVVAKVDVGDTEYVVHDLPIDLVGKDRASLSAACFAGLRRRLERVGFRFNGRGGRSGRSFRHVRKSTVIWDQQSCAS